jgi:hypothetical protein
VVTVPVQIALDAAGDPGALAEAAQQAVADLRESLAQAAADAAQEGPAARAARAARLGLGSAVLAVGTGGRVALGGTGFHGPGEQLPGQAVLDTALGLADLALGAAQQAGRAVDAVVAPVAQAALRPAVRTATWPAARLGRWAAPVLGPLQERGRRRREQSEREAAQTAVAVLPTALGLVLDNIDITGVMLAKIDLAELIEATFEQVDVTEIALSKVDLERVLAASLEQLDLTKIAMEHVDLQTVVERSIAEVDVVALVRAALEGRDLAELFITTPTGLAGEALRQTSRLVRRR